MQNVELAQKTKYAKYRISTKDILCIMQAGFAQHQGLTNDLMTSQHRAGHCPTTGMPHISPTGAKASGHTVKDCSKACREVGGRAGRKEELEGREGKMVGGHQIDNSSA